MPVTPAGSVSLPLQYLKKSLAASTSFQAAVGAASASAAEAYIFHRETESARPRAIIGFERNLAEKGGTTQWPARGRLKIAIEIATPAEHASSIEDANWWWTNLIGAIVDEMQALAMTAGYLSMTGNEVRNAQFGRADPDNNQGVKFFAAEILIDWRGEA